MNITGVTQVYPGNSTLPVENIICNTSAAQVANFRAKIIFFHCIFPFCSSQAMLCFLLIYSHFTVALLSVFKCSYDNMQTSLDCKGLLLHTRIRTEEPLILTLPSYGVSLTSDKGSEDNDGAVLEPDRG